MKLDQQVPSVTPAQHLALQMIFRGDRYDYVLFCCDVPENAAAEGEFLLRMLQKGIVEMHVTDKGKEVLASGG